MMALVFGVMAASIFAGSMHFVFGSQSTNTAVAPAIQIASAVAKNVFGCVMTSSPGPMPSAMKREPDRVGAVAGADGVLHAVKRRQLLLELLEHRPLTYSPLSSTRLMLASISAWMFLYCRTWP